MKGRKANKNKQKQQKGSVSLVPVLKQSPVLKPQRMTLHAVVSFDKAATTANDIVMYLNDAYNPFGTQSSAQGYWYDQLSTMYKKVFVEAARWKLSAISVATGRSITVAFPSTDPTAVTNSFGTTMMRPNAQFIQAPLVSLNTPVSIGGSVRTREFIDYKDWQDADNLQSTTVADSLDQFVYLHISTDSSQADASFIFEIWQDAIFFAPITQVAS